MIHPVIKWAIFFPVVALYTFELAPNSPPFTGLAVRPDPRKQELIGRKFVYKHFDAANQRLYLICFKKSQLASSSFSAEGSGQFLQSGRAVCDLSSSQPFLCAYQFFLGRQNIVELMVRINIAFFYLLVFVFFQFCCWLIFLLFVILLCFVDLVWSWVAFFFT